MDTIITIIVTVLANAIVTGIIVYLIQKRIERSYTRQMEEFKASLQYSNFEQQTKFTNLHAKRAETLETLYHKFAHLIEIFWQAFTNSLEVQAEVMGELLDLHAYFLANRLLLPEGYADEIEEMVEKTILLIGRADYASCNHDNKTLFDEIHNEVYEKLDKQSAALERLYKSLAEAQ